MAVVYTKEGMATAEEVDRALMNAICRLSGGLRLVEDLARNGDEELEFPIAILAEVRDYLVAVKRDVEELIGQARTAAYTLPFVTRVLHDRVRTYVEKNPGCRRLPSELMQAFVNVAIFDALNDDSENNSGDNLARICETYADLLRLQDQADQAEAGKDDE